MSEGGKGNVQLGCSVVCIALLALVFLKLDKIMEAIQPPVPPMIRGASWKVADGTTHTFQLSQPPIEDPANEESERRAFLADFAEALASEKKKFPPIKD